MCGRTHNNIRNAYRTNLLISKNDDRDQFMHNKLCCLIKISCLKKVYSKINNKKR